MAGEPGRQRQALVSRVKFEGALVDSAARWPLRGRNNTRDVMFSLALSRSAVLSEQAVCPIVSLGHSLGDLRPVPEGTRAGVNEHWPLSTPAELGVFPLLVRKSALSPCVCWGGLGDGQQACRGRFSGSFEARSFPRAASPACGPLFFLPCVLLVCAWFLITSVRDDDR